MSQRRTMDHFPQRSSGRQRSDRVFLSSSSPIKQESPKKKTESPENSPMRERALHFLQRNEHLIGQERHHARGASYGAYGGPYAHEQDTTGQREESLAERRGDLQLLADPEASGNDDSEEPSPHQNEYYPYPDNNNDYDDAEEDAVAVDEAELSQQDWEEKYRLENEIMDDFEKSQEAEVASLQESVKEAMGELAKVQEGNAELAETLKATQSRKQKAQQDRDAQQAEVEKLKNRLEAKRNKEMSDKKEIEELREYIEVKLSVQELQDLTVELDDLRQKESTLYQEAKESESSMQSKIEEIERRTRENEKAYTKEIRDKEERLKQLNHHLSETEYQANTASAVAAEAARLKKRLKNENAWKSHKELFHTVKDIMNEQNRLRDILHHVKMNRREEEDKYQKAKYQRDCLYTQLSALVTAAEAASTTNGSQDAVDRVNLDEATAYALSDMQIEEDEGDKNGDNAQGDNAEQSSDPSELLERLGGMLEYMDGTLTEELIGNQYRTIQ